MRPEDYHAVAAAYWLGFPEDSAERMAIALLVWHAAGEGNAKPWGWLHSELAGRGLSLTKNQFQNLVVGPSRVKGGLFICSCRRGYYIATCDADYEPMLDFYRGRIAQESARLLVLEQRLTAAGTCGILLP